MEAFRMPEPSHKKRDALFSRWQAALSGQHSKAPGFAGGYLLGQV
jgi:hypothetical protein